MWWLNHIGQRSGPLPLGSAPTGRLLQIEHNSKWYDHRTLMRSTDQAISGLRTKRNRIRVGKTERDGTSTCYAWIWCRCRTVTTVTRLRCGRHCARTLSDITYKLIRTIVQVKQISDAKPGIGGWPKLLLQINARV